MTNAENVELSQTQGDEGGDLELLSHELFVDDEDETQLSASEVVVRALSLREEQTEESELMDDDVTDPTWLAKPTEDRASEGEASAAAEQTQRKIATKQKKETQKSKIMEKSEAREVYLDMVKVELEDCEFSDFILMIKKNNCCVKLWKQIVSLDLPYSNNDIWIDNINSVLHITVKLKLEITWEDSNIIHLTLNKKYMGETCGLCGNYNGNSTDDLVYGGLVFDDITGLGCIPIEDCSCTYDKEIYPPGSVHNSTCSTCLCSGGHWNCKEIPCPSTCAVEGGSHITTFDKAEYIFNGKCVYVLAKPCANSTFAVNIEMKKCAYSASATCLTKVFLYLDGGLYEVEIAYDNYDFPQVHFDKKIMAKAGVTIFWPSSFYIIVYTNKGLYLEVQLTPIMQLYVVLEPSYKEKMCGLCGNFNGIQKDDFQTSRGEIESNAVDFANTWKANFKCKNRQPTYDHPCIYGMEVGNICFGYSDPSRSTIDDHQKLPTFRNMPLIGAMCCLILMGPSLLVMLHVCGNGTWVCDSKAEKGVCTLYGEGHYITFDNKYYTTNGNCEYTLVQDYCDIEHLWNGTFKVISENIPCGTTGTSCSKAITLYLGAHKVILANEVFEVLQTSNDVNIPYKIRSMGLFIIIETNIGLVLMWDRKSSIYIYLSPYFKGKVCGLCGNFDGNANNDFTTRSQCVVENVKRFRDSWKVSHLCPEVYISKDPCAVNPYRLAWAQKLCNIIFSDVFAPCHSEVAPEKFHENCIKDTCACDLGGDCECYCTAVAAYAQACSEACVCINWRSPTVCPVFCDFYNDEDQCDWHYKPCGGHCMKTCRNPKGLCMSNLKGLEGCYPKCTADKPFFDEDDMKCVSQCGCMDQEDNYYMVGETVESCNVCEICNCTTQGIECHYDIDGTDCNCEYEGQLMQIDEIIQVDNGFGGCKQVYCGIDGTVEFPCYTTIETTTGSLESSTTQMSTESTPSTTLSTPSTTLSTPSTTLSRPSTTLTTPSTTLTTPSTTLTTPSTTLSTQSTTLTTQSTTLATQSTTLTTPSTTLSTPSTTLSTPSTTLTTSSTILSTPSTTLTTPSTTLSTQSTTLTTPSTTLTTSSTILTTPSRTLTTPSTTLTTPSTTLTTQSTTLTTSSTILTTPSTTLTTQSLTLPPPITLTTPSTALIIPSTTHPASSGFSRQTENDVIIQSTEKFNISLPVFKTTQKQVVVRPVHYHNCNFTCTENGTIDESGLDCPDLENITCKGGNPPWKIYDQEGCCFYYDCPHCIGPLGVLKNPGDTWIDECSSCKCETYFEKQFITSKISCQPVRCPPIDFKACDEGTQKLFITFTNVNRCCPKVECQCDPSKCTYEELPCPLGFEAVAEAVEGECCAILYCRPMNVCIADGAIYQIGQEISVNKSLCKTCICSRVKNATNGFNTISCKSILCMKHCPQGFIYKKSTEDCCGKCVQVACVITAPDGSTLLLKANQSKFLPNDNCTQYTCECIGENFITSSQKKVCPARTEEDCTSDLLQTTPDGCCTVCTAPKKCMLQKVTTQISQKGCSAKVTLAYCEGWCLSYRRFSETSLQMAGKCECCMETKLAKLQVTLLCPWGKSILIDVYSPTSCACSPVTCV
ncbi:mucin-2-like [Eleutherodactylus coqui]|uniref:mucin-2-like n=1 Tax=Eleutherodactylus coqui TaxID=57060 RepID=UPI00346366B0